MTGRARRRVAGRGAGVAAMAVTFAAVSTGFGANAGAVEARATLTADVALSVAKGKAQSEKGVDSTTLTYTLSNKGPGDAPDGKVHVTLAKGAAFGSLPKECRHDLDAVTCGLGTIAKGKSKTVALTVKLTGTRHEIEGVGSGAVDIDPDLRNNVANATWDSQAEDPKPGSSPSKPESKPSTKPSAKPSPSTSASAKPKPKCSPAKIEYSKDGGKTWTRSGLIGGFYGKIQVRLVDKSKVEKNCQYKVSLASYSADGPTWKTSGTQRYIGKDTVTLTAKKPSATLDIKKYLPPCYGQIDLYGGGDKFTGAKTPHYPDKKYPTNMIAGWNGGKACAPKPPSSSPTPSKSPSTSPKPSPSVSASPSPSASESPSASPSPSVSESPSATPSEVPSTPPASQPPVQQPPAEVPVVAQPDDQQPVAAEPVVEGSLPKTGASRIPYLIALGVFTVLLGALAVWWTRQRPQQM
ncbi:LPXTG cell wall anchor domain-containing protein [Yinghuangia aomiensis]